jgi:hypothetical protein
MIISCVAALTILLNHANIYPRGLFGAEVLNCTYNTETNRTWMEINGILYDSKMTSRLVLNHNMGDGCNVYKREFYVSDKKGSISAKDKFPVWRTMPRALEDSDKLASFLCSFTR